MIIKEKYTNSARLNNLSGTIIFFANKKFEIKNLSNLLNSSQVNLLKKNLKNNTKNSKVSFKKFLKIIFFIEIFLNNHIHVLLEN